MDRVRETENYLSLMLEYMPVAVGLYDVQDWRLLAANPQMLTIMDTTLDPAWQGGQTIGHTISEWLPTTELPNVSSIFRSVAESGTPFETDEFTFASPVRGLTYWHLTVHPIHNANGTIIQLIQTANETTEQVLAHRELEKNRQSISRVNTAATEGHKRLEVIETVAHSVSESWDTKVIATAAIDSFVAHFKLRSIYIHTADLGQQALRLLHMHTSIPQAEALSLVEYVPFESKLLMAQTSKRREPIIISDISEAISEGLIESNHILVKLGVQGYISIPLWFKDHFEGALTASFFECIQPDAPVIQALLGCSTYIAGALAHARMHVEIKNERARLQGVFDQLPEGVVMLEAPGWGINFTNAAAKRLLDVFFEERGSTLSNQYHNQHSSSHRFTEMGRRSLFTKDFARMAQQDKPVIGQEILVTKPDGQTIALLASTAPFHDMINGEIIGMIGLFQDITQQKNIEAHKNAFTALASRRLRAPIITIQNLVEKLQAQSSQGSSLDSPDSLRAISDISEESERLNELIEEMLDLSRIDNARLRFNFASHDLFQTLSQAVKQSRLTTKEHDIHLVAEGLSPINILVGYFDEERIRQVVHHLINNAIRFSPAGNEIQVGLRYSKDAPNAALVWVKDHGVGIAAADLPTVFERFHHAQDNLYPESGLGVGLYLVKELVTGQRGHIWAESVEGKGSTFYIWLPLTIDDLA